jgi:hypothetical protein
MKKERNAAGYVSDQQPTGKASLYFLRNVYPSMVISSCLFLKEKTGTFWIPVLVHALYDFLYTLFA